MPGEKLQQAILYSHSLSRFISSRPQIISVALLDVDSPFLTPLLLEPCHPLWRTTTIELGVCYLRVASLNSPDSVNGLRQHKPHHSLVYKFAKPRRRLIPRRRIWSGIKFARQSVPKEDNTAVPQLSSQTATFHPPVAPTDIIVRSFHLPHISNSPTHSITGKTIASTDNSHRPLDLLPPDSPSSPYSSPCQPTPPRSAPPNPRNPSYPPLLRP